MNSEETGRVVEGILHDHTAVATMERSASLDEFLDQFVSAGHGLGHSVSHDTARRLIEEAFSAVHGHQIPVDKMTTDLDLTGELDEVHMQFSTAPSPASLLVAALTRFPGHCWTSGPNITLAC